MFLGTVNANLCMTFEMNGWLHRFVACRAVNFYKLKTIAVKTMSFSLSEKKKKRKEKQFLLVNQEERRCSETRDIFVCSHMI